MTNEERLKRDWRDQDEGDLDAAIKALVEHRQTRKFLWWLLKIGRIGNQPYQGNALNTAFACGELNVGQQVLDRITSISPEGYLIMMKESADERRTRDTALGTARDADRASRADFTSNESD